MQKQLFFIFLFLVSCSSARKNQNDIVIHDIDADFPTADTVEFTPLQSFEILAESSSFYVKDTVLFVAQYNTDRAGVCYSINSGKELSTIINVGNAANETSPSVVFQYSKDSIHVCDDNSVKTFAYKDILSKPMGERYFSLNKIPDTLITNQFKKINNETVFGLNSNASPSSENRNYIYFTYDGKDLSFFGEIGSDIFDTKNDYEMALDIKRMFQVTRFGFNKNRLFAANSSGITLQIVDPYGKKIIKERFYTKYKYNKYEKDLIPTIKYRCLSVHCTDEYIYSVYQLKDEEKSAEAGRNIFEKHIFVFDWDLNPVKKYFVMRQGKTNFSQDGKSLYLLVSNEEKVDLLECKL